MRDRRALTRMVLDALDVRGWTRGKWLAQDGSVCIQGAIQCALGAQAHYVTPDSTPDDENGWELTDDQQLVFAGAVCWYERFLRSLNIPMVEPFLVGDIVEDRQGDQVHESLMRWNDDGERTVGEVREFLKDAVAEADREFFEGE